MSEEFDRVLGHADEADGIEEYDNPLPAWWLGIFYISVIYGVVYGVHYHFLAYRSQAGDYEAELVAAAERWPAGNADAMAGVDPKTLAAAGEPVYQANCVGCHGVDLKGGIGPDLTDDEWVHGGSYEAITATVTNGVLEKGMPAWGAILGPEKTAQVSAFVSESGSGS